MQDHEQVQGPANRERRMPAPTERGDLSASEAALRLQRSAGNAAVQQLLQRVPNPALEAMEEPIPVPAATRERALASSGGAAEAPAKEQAPAEPAAGHAGPMEEESIFGWMKKKMNIGHATGEQVDEYVNGSPFIKKYVEDKVKGGTKAAGHVHADSPEDFKKAFIAYGQTRGMTEEAAKTMEPDVNAFRDGSEIHVHVDRGEFATTVHESMHLFSHDDYRNKLGFNANEGATEYFTRKVCVEQGITRGDFYAEQYASTKKLADLVGEDKLAAAYYQGKVDELKTAVDTKKAAGIFDQWVAKMQAGKYSEADGLL